MAVEYVIKYVPMSSLTPATVARQREPISEVSVALAATGFFSQSAIFHFTQAYVPGDPLGFMESPIPYSSIEDVNIISRWDAGQKFCIRITIPDGSVLLQANNSYLRDQWLHSIQWKRHALKYEKLLKNTRRPEVLIKEIKNMIDLSLSTPIQDESVCQFPLDLVSQLLQENSDTISQVAHEQIIVALAPLLENNHPTQEICDFFSKHCKNSPRSEIVIELFTPVVRRILKHNMLPHYVVSLVVKLNARATDCEIPEAVNKTLSHSSADYSAGDIIWQRLSRFSFLAVCLRHLRARPTDLMLLCGVETTRCRRGLIYELIPGYAL
ncbi:hypothetical protein LSH36_442g03106 [Paralvinella palmiformis]|uniref:C-Maf-inducing protein PH domain-containing protein n=1 Tax=Paralvinella palmiformis TaxID=53620 RepID=A0AAD9N0F5_9ANNE|nr:hypothetical protein LSH36_442g03106 [Paralvinella palmiformis]